MMLTSICNGKDQAFHMAWDIGAEYWLTELSQKGSLRLDTYTHTMTLSVPENAMMGNLCFLVMEAHKIIISHKPRSGFVQVSFEDHNGDISYVALTNFDGDALPKKSDSRALGPQWTFIVCFEDGSLCDNVAYYRVTEDFPDLREW